MKLLYYLLLAPYNVWAYTWFVLLAMVTALLYVFTLLLVRRNPGKWLYRWNYLYAKVWGALVGIRYQVEGKQYFQPGQAYVITPNHRALADVPLVAVALHPIAYRPLSKIELKDIPLMGYLFKNALILIDRQNPDSRHHGVDMLKQLLREEGISPVIFPEGTRNRTGQPLKAFYPGAFRIAIECQIPIMPMLLLNVDAITPQNSILIRPGKLTCRFLPAIGTEGMTEADVPALQQRVFDLMWKEIEGFGD